MLKNRRPKLRISASFNKNGAANENAKIIENKKKDNRLSIDENSIQAKRLKRKGAFEVNKEKVSAQKILPTNCKACQRQNLAING